MYTSLSHTKKCLSTSDLQLLMRNPEMIERFREGRTVPIRLIFEVCGHKPAFLAADQLTAGGTARLAVGSMIAASLAGLLTDDRSRRALNLLLQGLEGLDAHKTAAIKTAQELARQAWAELAARHAPAHDDVQLKPHPATLAAEALYRALSGQLSQCAQCAEQALLGFLPPDEQAEGLAWMTDLQRTHLLNVCLMSEKATTANMS